MKPRVAILGANGQVGSELALLLARTPECEVRGVVRSNYGAALLRLAGIPHATASAEDETALRTALGDCDVVVDLTYPGGQLVDIPGLLSRNMKAVLQACRPGARYLHMSSIMAYGTASEDSVLRDHRFPRASYGRIKRWAEGEAIRLCEAAKVEPYIVRLGQVHGVLQGVTQEYRRRTESGHLALFGERSALTNTLFAGAVADTVLACACGALAPATVYTLVSNPQWTLAELGLAYQRLYNPAAELTFHPSGGRPRSDLLRRLAAGSQARELLETYVFLHSPGLFVRLKGRYRMRGARAHQAPAAPQRGGAPLLGLLGAVPGTLVPGIDSSIETTIRSHEVLAAAYDAYLTAATR